MKEGCYVINLTYCDDVNGAGEEVERMVEWRSRVHAGTGVSLHSTLEPKPKSKPKLLLIKPFKLPKQKFPPRPIKLPKLEQGHISTLIKESLTKAEIFYAQNRKKKKKQKKDKKDKKDKKEKNNKENKEEKKSIVKVKFNKPDKPEQPRIKLDIKDMEKIAMLEYRSLIQGESVELIDQAAAYEASTEFPKEIAVS